MKYKVCIHCLTFNHEDYLEDALKGFVMQKTDFPFAVIVIDDFSTDGTAAILKKYEEMYPDIVKGVYLQENYFSQNKSKLPIFKELDEGCEYVALCEGDDYWTDPLKLQKQVEWMENHPDCIMCCSAANWESNGVIDHNDRHYDEDRDLSVDEIIRNGGLYVATASMVCRSSVYYNKPHWRLVADVGDYPLQINCALDGTVHYFSDITCVYRFERPGSWTATQTSMEVQLKHRMGEVEWMEELDRETQGKYSSAIYSHLLPSFLLLLPRKYEGYSAVTKNSAM